MSSSSSMCGIGQKLSSLQEKEIEASDKASQGVSSFCGAGGLNSLSSWLDHLLVCWWALSTLWRILVSF